MGRWPPQRLWTRCPSSQHLPDRFPPLPHVKTTQHRTYVYQSLGWRLTEWFLPLAGVSFVADLLNRNSWSFCFTSVLATAPATHIGTRKQRAIVSRGLAGLDTFHKNQRAVSLLTAQKVSYRGKKAVPRQAGTNGTGMLCNHCFNCQFSRDHQWLI